ncbi:MAG: DUF2971 domain-containing protein [Verrucomicrobia bacterium]|nr:DUF2971 domain-containing protein [Verrucomicrobiota bacterium]
MILYKYLPPSRLDVLKRRLIRFTQPGDFNDSFEFRPQIATVNSEGAVREYVAANFDQLVEQELSKYGALVQSLPQAALKQALLAQKEQLPNVYRMLEAELLPKVSGAIDGILNQKVGVLCLSELRDSLLMWGHYTDNHQGFLVGFDSDHKFFSKRRSAQDEFGFLRRVDYVSQRPCVELSDTSSPVWFQTKSEQWAYEKEWWMVRVLSEADDRIERQPFPVCLFRFEPEAVREIVIGMRFPSSVVPELRSVAAAFPNASLLRAREHSSSYGLLIDEIK